ncbi:MAG: pyrroline-5-carboxylate reductase [Phycisphaerales bacterium]|nr:MAG: pyrroline-5-carboxylate reductase [Phycisphaerales bacterium]
MHTMGVIGGGNMARAIIEGAIRQEVLEPESIIVAEINESRLSEMAALGCAVTRHAGDVVDAEQIMLAIKPQVMAEVAKTIAPMPESRPVISIMAGRHSSTIRAALGEHARIVRVMPNTPCQIGAGMSVIALGEGAQPGDEALAEKLFSAIGRCLTMDESHMHAVTAVSGSGPAYLFLFAEAMEQAADQLGLPHRDGRTLVAQTLLGAARLLNESGQTADQLRQSVTSPGGTTAAAIEVMFEGELPQIVAEALLAARQRGEELDVG